MVGWNQGSQRGGRRVCEVKDGEGEGSERHNSEGQ